MQEKFAIDFTGHEVLDSMWSSESNKESGHTPFYLEELNHNVYICFLHVSLTYQSQFSTKAEFYTNVWN